MNNTKQILLRVLGLKRKKPKTKLGQILRWCEYGLTGVLLLYILLLAYPQPLFSNTFEHKGICLYSNDPIPEESVILLEKVRSRINESDLNQGENIFRVFLCNSKWLYTLFHLPYGHGFAVNYRLTDNIFVAQGDLKSNQCKAFRLNYNERALDGVVTHEICHVLIRHQLGFWSYLSIPTWLDEGFCDLIAGDSSFPASLGDQLIIEGKSDPSSAFQYYTYRKMIDYLINVEGFSIKQLVKNTPEEQEVLRKIRNWLCTQKIEQDDSQSVN